MSNLVRPVLRRNRITNYGAARLHTGKGINRDRKAEEERQRNGWKSEKQTVAIAKEIESNESIEMREETIVKY